jgi:hypothetical protein
MDGFWTTLSAKAAKICLCRLHISFFPHESPAGMMASIPEWVHVQELHFDKGMKTDGVAKENECSALRTFCHAIWRNGSLRIVSAKKKFPNFQNRACTRMVQASLQRNCLLPQLLSIPDAQRRDNETLYIANGSIYPTLLKAGKQASRFALKSLLMGVTAMGESIGPLIQD